MCWLWHATEIGALLALLPLMMKPPGSFPLSNPPPEGEGTNEPLREFLIYELAGLPALQLGEPGQVRKEAATAKYCKCRG